MKKILTTLTIIAIMASMAAVMAQDKPAPIKGTVASVNSDDKSFKLNFKDTVFSVTTSEKTKYFKDMKAAEFGIVVTDVEVTIVGKVNKEEKNIEAMIVAVGKFEKPGDLPKPDFSAFGKVSNLGENTFTLENEKGSVTVNTTDKTKFISKEGKKAFADLEEGTEVTVAGNLDKETKTVTALVVFWGKKDKEDDKPQPVVGKASNVNVDAGTFTLTNDKGELTVKTIDKTKILPKDKTLADIADGETVAVVGKINIEEKTIEAVVITIGKPDKDKVPKPVTGTVGSINKDSMTFTLTAEDGKTVKVSWSDKTKFFLGKEKKTADDLSDGATIAVMGKVEDDVLKAILVSLDGKLPKKP